MTDRQIRARQTMIEGHLKGRGITDPAVLSAMESVPREKFVPADLVKSAYDDSPLAIGYGQTISQPYIVALMLQKLEVSKTDKTLEIGAGSGYQAAVLSQLAQCVYTVEIIEPLAEQCADRLKRLGYENVTVRHGNGSIGWARNAPYDKIISAATAPMVPSALEDQLAEGGRIIAPIGDTYYQELRLGVKREGKISYETGIAVRFVPMKGIADN